MIPLAVPNLTGNEIEYTRQAIISNHVGPNGPFVERFEEMVAKRAGYSYAVATSSCSQALLAAFRALRFEGREICLEKCAFPAAKHALQSLGCKLKYWEDEDGVYGYRHDHCSYNINDDGPYFFPEVDDCAPAIGAVYSESTVACFSFAANKTVTCGTGGVACMDDNSLREAIGSLICNRGFEYACTEARMANINAAIGCAQMERLDEFIDKKRSIWKRYEDAGLPMVDRGPSRWMSSIWLDGIPVDNETYRRLEESEIGHRIEFRDPDPEEDRFCLSIPCSTSLSEADQDKVIKTVLG